MAWLIVAIALQRAKAGSNPAAGAATSVIFPTTGSSSHRKFVHAPHPSDGRLIRIG